MNFMIRECIDSKTIVRVNIDIILTKYYCFSVIMSILIGYDKKTH